MKVKILRNLAKPLPPFKEGEEQDVDDALAEKWIAEGLAEQVRVEVEDSGRTEAEEKEAQEALKAAEGAARLERDREAAKAKAALEVEEKAKAEKQSESGHRHQRQTSAEAEKTKPPQQK